MLTTERLLLRNWQDGDYEKFIALNSDPAVMEFFPSLYTREETVSFIDVFRRIIDETGCGFWAAEERSTGDFVGMIGLNNIPERVPVAQKHEVGWRLSKAYWGRGYATEGGRASLEYGFNQLGLDHIVAFTAKTNLRSIRVMERLGMMRQVSTFKYPGIDEASSLSEHVLYLLQRDDFIRPDYVGES